MAHFALQNTASNSAKKKNRPREGVAEGGVWGEFRLARAGSVVPATLLVQSRPTKKSFVFLLEEKNRARANKKLQTKLFFGGASKASGGGAERIIGRFAQKMFELRPRSTAQKNLPLKAGF